MHLGTAFFSMPLSLLLVILPAHAEEAAQKKPRRIVAQTVQPACADPAADIEIALVAKTGPTTGRVRITGIVKNLGSAAWVATSPSHRLQMVLARRNTGARPEGEPVQPAIAIRQMAPGQQYRIDYQINWNTDRKDSYPRFVVFFSDAGQVGAGPASYRPDCRSDNNRREITAVDINHLFTTRPVAQQPLKVQGYRLLGGVGINTVETILSYRKKSVNEGKITVSVAAPYSGAADEVPVSGSAGNATLRVHVPCDHQNPPPHPAPPVSITYRLWGSLGLPGGSGWVPGFSVEQSIPYRELCAPVSPGQPASPG